MLVGLIDLSTNKPVPGTALDANQIATGLQTIQNVVNGNIDTANAPLLAPLAAPTLASPTFTGAATATNAIVNNFLDLITANETSIVGGVLTISSSMLFYGVAPGTIDTILPVSAGRVLIVLNLSGSTATYTTAGNIFAASTQITGTHAIFVYRAATGKWIRVV